MVNGAAKKQATDDPSALAQRLSNIEARLGAIEAASRVASLVAGATRYPHRRAGLLSVRAREAPGTRATACRGDRERAMHRAPRPADSEPLRLVTVAAEIPTDVEALYLALLERLPPAERAELARLLLEDEAACAR